MASTWHTVATGDARLLRRQMDIVNGLPKDYVFLNYLRCHDDIGWGLDYPWLSQFGIQEVPHKRFLSDFFTGKFPDSFARGELYNDDPASGDAASAEPPLLSAELRKRPMSGMRRRWTVPCGLI